VPSQSNRKQIISIVEAETVCHVFRDQGGFTDEHFNGIYQRLVESCRLARSIVEAEQGELSAKEARRLLSEMDDFRSMHFREFEAERATSYCIAKFVDILADCRNSKKIAAFEAIKCELENLHTYFDPSWESDGINGYRAACAFGELAI